MGRLAGQQRREELGVGQEWREVEEWLTAAQPLPIVAPITASIEALREALELLVRRLYPAIAA